ncbi:MAG: DUF4004 family protein [Lachnospiraceae bacterium]|nr:DUF4004 family protein [Lachnospiraceae bacterium]
MDNEQSLISKKALLARYNISYGSLYRWKRKGLIPDEWFLRKTTVTGQETFFPEDLICERVELILSTKDDVLLDELAARLTGEKRNIGAIAVETNYGNHIFRQNDIRRVLVTGADGIINDVTQHIIDLIQGGIHHE